MKEVRPSGRAGQTRRSSGADRPPLDGKDLTCNEAQIEALLSEGESTESEAEDADQADKHGRK